MFAASGGPQKPDSARAVRSGERPDVARTRPGELRRGLADARQPILPRDGGRRGLAEAPTIQGREGGQAVEDPDAVYAQRENPASAARAAAVWAERLARRPTDFESAWKLARVRYFLGTHGPEGTRRAELESGMEAAGAAMKLEPNRPEGHFWLAANMGALAESHGLRNGLRYRKPIKAALELVVKLDPAYLQGSGDRALGRWYHMVPALFGGSQARSLEHLQRALGYAPDSVINHFFLAETLLALGRKAEARVELQKVIDLPANPDWVPEDRAFRARARTLLERLR